MIDTALCASVDSIPTAALKHYPLAWRLEARA